MGMIRLLAGGLSSGFLNSSGAAAKFYQPSGVAVDKSGNVFVTDKYNHVIRKITPEGAVTTFAGSGSVGSTDGQGTAASFYYPSALTIDPNDNLFVSDQYNHKIRKITPVGLVSTIAGVGYESFSDGPALTAGFYRPEGIALDKAGNLYVADYNNHRIRKITPAGLVSTLAGSGNAGSADGTGTAASFNLPISLTVDADGTVYVADQANNKIRKVTASGVVTTLAGSGTAAFADGKGSAASFSLPTGIVMDASGNLLVSDRSNNRIRRISMDGTVTTVAGNDTAGNLNGPTIYARLYFPQGLAFDSKGKLYIADRQNHQIRTLEQYQYTIQPALPANLTFDNQTGTIAGTPLTGMQTTNFLISAQNSSGMDTTTLTLSIVGKATVSTDAVREISLNSAVANGKISDLGYPNATAHGFCWNKSGSPTLSDSVVSSGANNQVSSYSMNMINLEKSTTYYVKAFATNPSGTVYGNEVSFSTIDIAPKISYAGPQTYTSGVAIPSLLPVHTGGAVSNNIPLVSTIAGNTSYGFVNGIGKAASFYYPTGVAVDKSGNIFVTDKYNHVIRKISPEGVVSTFAGAGYIGSANGQGTSASFYYPGAVVIDKDENLYISDQLNMKIRKITKSGMVSTYAGTGEESSIDGAAASSTFRRPESLVLDSAGNLYVAEFWGHKIRKISPSGIVSTVAGTGVQGSADGIGTSATFNYPCGITIDAAGNLYVADQLSNKIRKITPAGVVSTLAGTGVAGSVDGSALSATFNYPSAVLFDASGNLLVADRSSNKIRKISTDGMVSTVVGNETSGSADGTLDVARFNFPFAMTFDLNKNLIVADRYNHEIRKITLSGYTISPALPEGLVFNNLTGEISGTPLRGSEEKTYTISTANAGGIGTTTLKVTVNGKPVVTTETASSITASTAVVNGYLMDPGNPSPTVYGFCLNKNGMPTILDSIFTKTLPAMTGAFSMQLLKLAPGVTYYVRAFATNSFGTNYGVEQRFTTPIQVPNIQYMGPQTYTVGATITPLNPVNLGGPTMPFPYVFTLAGNGACASTNGVGTGASFANPASIAVDPNGNLFVADANSNVIRKITTNGVVTTFAGSGIPGAVDNIGVAASFNSPRGIAVDAKGNVYVGDTYNNKIRKITKEGVVTTLAGSGAAARTNGTGAAANFFFPMGVAVDTIGNVFVADRNNRRLCKITPQGVVSTLAVNEPTGIGDGVGGVITGFELPTGVAVDALGNVYVADMGSDKIYKYQPNGTIAVLAGSGIAGISDGTGTSASFMDPMGIDLDESGTLYVAEYSSCAIRKITPDGVVTTLAGGKGSSSYLDGKATVAQFSFLTDVALDKSGNIFVADYSNNRIRRIGSANYSISPVLPTGMLFDPQTGKISGRPLVSTNNTTYSIFTSNLGGSCISTLEIATLSIPQGIQDLAQERLSLYPNPAQQELMVKGLSGTELLTIYSLTGVKLLSQEVTDGVAVQVGNLDAGIYLVKVGGRELKLVKK